MFLRVQPSTENGLAPWYPLYVYPTACNSIENGVLKFRQNKFFEKDLNARLIKFSLIKSSQRYTMAKKARIMRIRMVNGMRKIWEQRLPTKELIEKLKSKEVIYPFLLWGKGWSESSLSCIFEEIINEKTESYLLKFVDVYFFPIRWIQRK